MTRPSPRTQRAVQPPMLPPSLLRTSAWRRGQKLVTVGLFAVATVVGVNVGLHGAAVSPVAPAVVAAAPGQVTPGLGVTDGLRGAAGGGGGDGPGGSGSPGGSGGSGGGGGRGGR